MIVPVKPFQPGSLMLVGEAGACPREVSLAAVLYERLLSLKNIRLGWKSSLGTNTLAHYEYL
jgi:hypothetical protein